MTSVINYAQFAITAITFLAAIVGAVAFLRAAWKRTTETELRNLVEARGQVIEDLRAEIHEQRKEIERLSEKVAEMHGQIEALQRIKSQEIAVEVARLLDSRGSY